MKKYLLRLLLKPQDFSFYYDTDGDVGVTVAGRHFTCYKRDTVEIEETSGSIYHRKPLPRHYDIKTYNTINLDGEEQ